MRTAAIPAVVAACLVSAFATGCAPCPDTMASLPQLLADYNANAAAVPRLWARAKVEVTLVNDSGLPITIGSASPLASPNAILLLGKNGEKPYDFVMVGKETVMDIFRMGSSSADGVYYFWYNAGDRKGAWFGRNELAGAEGVRDLLIDPHQLVSLLGVMEMPADLTQPPVVAMRMQNDPPKNCAYVLVCIDRQPVSNRLMLRREVYFAWSKTLPPRPYRVDFFDGAGRRVLTASIGEYKPVADSGAGGKPAIAPTDIRIEQLPWPGIAPRIRGIHIVLSEMTAKAKGNPLEQAKFLPNMPLSPDQAVQVDKDIKAPEVKPK